MKTLYLHIGHGKTGSSYIQSSLASSLDSLLEQGIYYPEVPGLDRVARGDVSSGNGKLLFEGSFLGRIPADLTADSMLFSSEHIFDALDEGVFISTVREICRRYQFETVSILLFIRNPVGHAESIYQQSIKRAGRVHTVSECFESYDGPQKVAKFLNKEFSFGPGVIITVKNYSYVKKDLLVHFSDWLSVPEATLKLPQMALINRSLTFGELEFQRFVNEVLGPSGQIVSDRLCARLPHIKADKIFPSEDVQASMYRRLLPEIELVNARVPQEHQYRKVIKTGVNIDSDEIKLNREQIKLLAQGLAYEILALSKL